jgi:hypothetical protein
LRNFPSELWWRVCENFGAVEVDAIFMRINLDHQASEAGCRQAGARPSRTISISGGGGFVGERRLGVPEHFRFSQVTEMLSFVFTQSRTQKRCALLLGIALADHEASTPLFLAVQVAM